MHPVGKIFVHCLLIFNTILNVNSGEHLLSNSTQKHSSTEVSDEAPIEFPKNATIVYNGKNFTLGNYDNMCWPNISKTFWRSMMHAEKPNTGKSLAMVRAKYEKLTKNVTDNIMRIIFTINELSTLLQNENILEFSKESVKEDSYMKTIMVPVLLIIILLLLTYIAFQHRKLQFARYKDAQILVQDELIDP